MFSREKRISESRSIFSQDGLQLPEHIIGLLGWTSARWIRKYKVQVRMEVPENYPLPKETRHSLQLGPSMWRASTREPKIAFSQFSREICTFEKNIKLSKMFCIKFSTKIILITIFTAIILTKLQRSESRANLRHYYRFSLHSLHFQSAITSSKWAQSKFL